MTPASLLEELLRYHQAKSTQTAELSELSHDDVCRAVQDKIEFFLGAFEKYKHTAYVVQGPRDNGVDVLLKGSLKDDELDRYVALQVKSYKELADRDAGVTKDLKTGIFDATASYGESLERYYILLCGDAKKHAKRIQAISNEFSKSKLARVIGPRHIKGFLDMPGSTMAAVVDRHLSEEDFVRNRAPHEVAGYSAPYLYFILSCICAALDGATE